MDANTGAIIGVVIDNNQMPIQYVNVMLHKQSDSSLVDAVSTDIEGKFFFQNVNFDTYFLEFKFLGFENKNINKIALNEENRFVKIGKVSMETGGDQQIDEVVVTSQISTVKYEIDKKVINVAKDIQASGGSAVDALQNVPSVQVDIEGNVTLRGSSNFTVMINGKPSILDANDALQQIQASNIERIEIITNPSAKYDPDGDAGIINIITKNKLDDGLSGKIELYGDNNRDYKTSVILNYKKNKLNILTEFNVHERKRPMGFKQYRVTTTDSNLFYMNNEGEHSFGHAGYNAKIGFIYDFNDFNSLSFNAEGGKRGFIATNTSNQQLWWSDLPTELYFLNTTSSKATGFDYDLDLNYEHKFNDKGHKIKTYSQFSNFNPEKTSLTVVDTTDEFWNSISDGAFQEQTIDNTERNSFRLQSDYELPFDDNTKLEAGYAYRYFKSVADYKVENYDIYEGYWVNNEEMYNNMTFDLQIHAGYVTFSNSFGKIIDLKAGMRVEYTDRKIYEAVTDSAYTIKRWDYFPTLHLSKSLPFDQQIQLSYSRRINRPHGWDLNPFMQKMDNYTIRKGNPALEPEYTNSFELNYMKEFGKSYVSVESYYKQTNGKIDRIMEVYEDKIIMTSANMNKDYAIGGEVMTNLVLFKMFIFNLSANFYNYSIDGFSEGKPVNEQTFTWDTRASLMTMLPFGTGIQFGGFYNAPSISLQGTTEGMFMTYAGIRQSFLKKQLTLSISVQDIFMTMGRKMISETPTLYSEAEFFSIRPTIGLTLTYNIRNYKQDKKQMNGESQEMDFSGEGMY